VVKQAVKKHDDVLALRDWIEDEIQQRKNDCAVQVLELAQSDAPDRYAQIDSKIAACEEGLQSLAKIRDWCTYGGVDHE
jgi:hypothetical protein